MGREAQVLSAHENARRQVRREVDGVVNVFDRLQIDGGVELADEVGKLRKRDSGRVDPTNVALDVDDLEFKLAVGLVRRAEVDNARNDDVGEVLVDEKVRSVESLGLTGGRLVRNVKAVLDVVAEGHDVRNGGSRVGVGVRRVATRFHDSRSNGVDVSE